MAVNNQKRSESGIPRQKVFTESDYLMFSLLTAFSYAAIHWRDALPQLAKYPYLIQALCQVIVNRRFQYILTSKVKENPATYTIYPWKLCNILQIESASPSVSAGGK